MQVYLCPKCGWTHDYVAMKPECPICLSYLNCADGTQEEIDARINEIKEKK